MPHLTLVILLNVLNSVVFWLLFKGMFHSAEDLAARATVCIVAFHIWATVSSVGALVIAGTRLARWGISSSLGLPEDERQRFGRVASLTGAYGIGSIWLLVGGFTCALEGTLDLWSLGAA